MIEQPNHKAIEPGQTVLSETKGFVKEEDPTIKKGVTNNLFILRWDQQIQNVI